MLRGTAAADCEAGACLAAGAADAALPDWATFLWATGCGVVVVVVWGCCAEIPREKTSKIPNKTFFMLLIARSPVLFSCAPYYAKSPG